MFDQLRAMGAVADLMKNQDKVRQAAARVRDRLDAIEVGGQAAGGAVRARVSGTMRVLGVEVAPALGAALAGHDAAQREQAAALLTEAVNDGLARAQQAARAAIEEEAAALGLPGLAQQLGGFLPGHGR